MRRRVMASGLLLLLVLLGAWLWTPDLDRAALEARHARGPADFVEVAGLRLHVRDDGPKDAPAVLMLHGFGASLHTWEDWAQALAPRHRVIRFDLPAAGLTGADPGGDYSDERSIQLMAALMDRLGVAQASVVGHSMGGRIAWRFAAAQPQRVDRLVLVAPDGFASPGFEYGKAPEVGAAVELMRHVLPRMLVTMSLQPAYADPAQMTDERATRYHELLRAPGVRAGLIERMRQLVLRDPVPLLQTIAAPTLLLWGERDGMVPAANAQDYLRVMPRARLVLLPAVGHIPQEEGGAPALAAVQGFLAE
jgi:pimeloyl-ACP methyl ester carboxylesterase